MSYAASGPVLILRLLKSRVVRLVFGIVSLVLIVVVARSSWDLWQKQDIVAQRKAELSRLEAENQRLNDQLREVQTPGFIERVAREKLGLVKEGETVVIIDRRQETGDRRQEEASENLPNWKKWWRLFF